MNSHATRTAVIIGASSGIGEALAHELNRAGWRLGLLARRLEPPVGWMRDVASDVVTNLNSFFRHASSRRRGQVTRRPARRL
jgi:NADP-dependent 3-hydroxy acid dehydrogenase YdfG